MQVVASINSVRIAMLAFILTEHYIQPVLFLILRTLISALRSHHALALKNLALRQLEVLQRNTKKDSLDKPSRTN